MRLPSAAMTALQLLLLVPRSTSSATPNDLMGLGAALLNSDFMPPSLLLQSRSAPVIPKVPAVSNATVGLALSTMRFHRRMMNEYLCRGYMAEDILERLQRDAEEVVGDDRGRDRVQASALQNRKGSNVTRRPGASRSGNVNQGNQSSQVSQGNHRPNQMLADEGSSSYRDWLARSAVLEDIYRRYEHVSNESDEEEQDDGEDRQSDSRDDDYDGEVTGWAMEEPQWSAGKQDSRHPEEDIGESYGGGHHHSSEYAEPIHSSSNSASALSLGIRDIFDVALTAIAFLAFGIFILNVFLGILLPSSSTRTVVISNLTLPFRNREGALDLGGDSTTHERIARWAEDQPERLETTEENAARLALSSLRAALRPARTHAHCLQAALCRGNKAARDLEGQAKYWLPVWSLGMSWLARRGGGAEGSEPGTAALFSGALENLRAATLGLAGARCQDLFPTC